MDNKYFELIKELRNEKKLSQEEIAEKIGVSRSSYIAFEKGEKELHFSQMVKLADMLGISLEEIETGLKPDYEKYKEMILAYLRESQTKDGRVLKTKLAKMLYLADFAWFYENLESMSGMQYRCLKFGPVPNIFFMALSELEEEGRIMVDHKKEMFLISENEGSKKRKLEKISEKESNLIRKISKKWEGRTTREIVDFTHNQLPYRLCSPGEAIPYELIIQEDPGDVY
ncbi:MAG: helix-turn-helix domain-containing protein [Candidatus Moranbacteria bacterium]|jgi:transcriptional regulator with XRE-family HTH domain|nr:helix-turn-helix domain-containing protein [Candidatus Moranbacteria bacterium]